jgi:hypothetical protein
MGVAPEKETPFLHSKSDISDLGTKLSEIGNIRFRLAGEGDVSAVDDCTAFYRVKDTAAIN